MESLEVQRVLAQLAAILEQLPREAVLRLDSGKQCHLWRIGPEGCTQMAAELPEQLAEGDRYLSAKEVAAHLDISERSVWRWLRDGLLPRPVYWKNRLPRWRLSDVSRFAHSQGRPS